MVRFWIKPVSPSPGIEGVVGFPEVRDGSLEPPPPPPPQADRAREKAIRRPALVFMEPKKKVILGKADLFVYNVTGY